VVSDQAADMLGGDMGEEGVALFAEWVQETFPVSVSKSDFLDCKGERKRGPNPSPEQASELVFGHIKSAYELKVQAEAAESMTDLERSIILRAIDSRWQDYLRSIDSLREGVGLRAYGQRDPLIEYKREAFDMFENLMADIKDGVASQMFRTATSAKAITTFLSSLPRNMVHDEVSILGGGAPALPQSAGLPPQLGGGGDPRAAAPRPTTRDEAKVGRNDPCPCGSGKKYKKCHGAS
jgi:preprotein translocase subunit SecA